MTLGKPLCECPAIVPCGGGRATIAQPGALPGCVLLAAENFPPFLVLSNFFDLCCTFFVSADAKTRREGVLAHRLLA